MSWKLPKSAHHDDGLSGLPVDIASLKLPPRLRVVASMLSATESVVDIGTDHGQLPVELVRSGRVKRAIAGDVNPEPLQGAKRKIAEAGLEGAVESRLGSGFGVLQKGDVEAATIAGMGGERMAELIEAGRPESLGVVTLVLQPNSDAPALRRTLWQKGWEIEDERLCVDNGRFFLTIKATWRGLEGHEPTLEERLVGPVLPARGGALVEAWLGILAGEARTRLRGLRAGGRDLEEIGLCEARLSLYEDLMSKK